MNIDAIQSAANRVALQEQALQEASAKAEATRERLSALYQRRDAIAAEISSIRSSFPPGEIPEDKAARAYCLGLDAEDLEGVIAKATQEANDAAAAIDAESMALSVAQRDFKQATAHAEIKAIEAKVREAERAMMSGIAHLYKLKREAGAFVRSMSDIYRPGNDFDRMVRLGAIPPEVR